MLLISHRGNVNGKQELYENSEVYIETALNLGYDVELDIFFINGSFYLGHDKPQHETTLQFLSNPRFWVHCKNVEALYQLSNYSHINYFFHDTDDATLTSKGYIWTYPGKTLTKNSICVLPSINPVIGEYCGICSDYIERYKIKKV
jgi:hypothetical protein